MTGNLANYLHTISAAKDHEFVRAALGEKMNWLGLSYRTQLGAQYAQLFPDNIRAMVLDGIVQHSQAESSNVLVESTAYATALESFFQWAGNDDASILKGQDFEKIWYDILKNATIKPVPTPGCNGYCRADVTEEEIRLNTQGALLSAENGSRAAVAKFLNVARFYDDATGLSTPFASNDSIGPHLGLTIGCQDWAFTEPSFEDLQAKMRLGETFAPLNKGASQSYMLQAYCIGWPAPLSNPRAKLNVQTPNPILMVNAIRDPSTSYSWAVGMLEEIKNSVLLTRNGDGHTSWSLGGATTDAINHFLLTNELPAPGTVLDS